MLALLFIIGLFGNLIGTLAGGGGLITLPTMLLLGMPVHSAIGANKVSNTISTLSSFYTVFRRQEITIAEAGPIVLLCFIGGLVGGLIASLFTGETLTILALCLLIFAFVLSFLGKTDFGDNITLHLKNRTRALLISVGIYDGMFGPGSGTLLLYIYAGEKLSYMKAVVLGRVGIFATCFGAAITYVLSGQILWTETIFLMLGSIIGSQAGIILARKVNNQHAKLLLRFITIILIVQLALDLFIFN
ncbi:TSUP family transporter [Solibacillus sp. CAU 1738]|uniref:sulfite exporter TauE/SafE family protein n=1 Tax=Solibacillus sp. CAU 1738 TaxID=3140363 RepID=UPI00326092C3